MKIPKHILISIFGETESEAADLCEILDENSDLGVDEPLIDLAVDQT